MKGVLDQTFAFNLMSPQALLDQSVGKEVSIVTTNPATGRDATERAKVISVQNGVVLDIGGKIYTGLGTGRVVFDSAARQSAARCRRLLIRRRRADRRPDIPIELSYLTSGLGWHADYVANYDGEAGRLDLTGWATVSNTTGVEFKDAKVKLAAGADINRVAPQPGPRPMMRATAMSAVAGARSLAAEAVGHRAAEPFRAEYLYPRQAGHAVVRREQATRPDARGERAGEARLRRRRPTQLLYRPDAQPAPGKAAAEIEICP